MTPRLGLVLPYSDGAGLRTAGERAEEIGFDILAVGEHVLMPTPMPSAFNALSFLAAITERARLLTSIALAPLYPAPLLAKLVTSLDALSDGRLDLGLGVGGEFPAEFDACGVPVSERGARLDEFLDVLRVLAPGTPVDFDGRFTSFHSGQMLPGSKQRPVPPIWIAGRSEAAMRRAARAGDVWLPYLMTPEQLTTRRAILDEAAAEAGRTVETAVFCWTAVDHDGAAARRHAAEYVGRIYRQDFTGRAGRLLVAGTPAECRATFDEYADAGATALILCLAQPPGPELLRAVDLLGAEISR